MDEKRVAELARKLASSFPTDPDQPVRAARDFAAEGRILEARLILREVLPRLSGPESWEISLDLARLERQAREFKAALALTDKLAAGGVPESSALAGQTLAAEILLTDLRDHARAQVLLDGLLKAFPAARERTRWSVLLARCVLARLDWKGARSLLGPLETASGTGLEAEVGYLLSRIDLAENKLEEARERLQTIVLKHPHSASANLALRELFFMATHREEGKPFVTAEYHQQRLAVECGRFDEFDRRAAAIDPAKLPPAFRPDFALLSARALRARGQPAKAIDVLSRLAKEQSESPALQDGLLLLADIHEHDLKDPAKAKAVLADFLMLYPTGVAAEEVRERLEGPAPRAMPAQGVDVPAQ
jgi:predicted Zn-dependent protease